MFAPLLLSLATAAAPGETDAAVEIRPCEYPLWVTFIDQRAALPVERDYAGCGDGPLQLQSPEGAEIGDVGLAAEEARLVALSARVDGETLRISFQPRGQDHPLEIATGFDTTAIVGDGSFMVRVRRATGGPYVRAITRDQPVADFARALARVTGERLAGDLPFGDERITADFFRVSVVHLWEHVSDAGNAQLAYWPEQRVVRFWRGAVPSTTADKSAIPSATVDPAMLALPEVRPLYATADAAARLCAATGQRPRCIALHEKVLALLPPEGPIGRYQRLESTIALLDAYRAAGRSEDARHMDRLLADAVRAGDVRDARGILEYLRQLLDLDAAPESVGALFAAGFAHLADQPPQQVRLSRLALDAMRLEPHAGEPDGARRLRQLDHRYFEIEFSPKRLDLASVGIRDPTMELIRRSLARSAERVAEASIARQAINDARFALDVAEFTPDEDTAAIARVEALRAQLEALQQEVARTRGASE